MSSSTSIPAAEPAEDPAETPPGRTPPRRRASRATIVLVVLALVAVAAALLSLRGVADVVDRGHDVRPYESGEVFKVRLADAVTVYFDEESNQFDGDVISGAALVALTTTAAMTLLLLGAARAPRRLRRFYAFAMLGFGWLALDELIGLHESIGHNLPFLADLPGVERPDDVVFALYFVPALAMVVAFRDVLGSSPLARRLFLALIPMFGLAGVLDITGSPLDEPLELLCAATGAAGFVVLMKTHLEQHVGFGRERSAGVGSPRPRVADG